MYIHPISIKILQFPRVFDVNFISFVLYFSGNMSNHTFIQGFSGKGLLLYLENEKNLFIEKSKQNRCTYYECYHVLQKSQPDYKPCPVRCVVEDGECRRNGRVHSHEMNHKIQYRDMQSLNAMKETCRWLREHCPSSAYKIPLYDIFMLEISKWVFPLLFELRQFRIGEGELDGLVISMGLCFYF